MLKLSDKMHKLCRNGFLSKICSHYYQRTPGARIMLLSSTLLHFLVNQILQSLRYQSYIYKLLIGSSGSYFRLSSNLNFDYLQNIKLLAKVGIPSLQLQVVLLDSIWYLQGSSKESTLLEFKYLFHKIPLERVWHIWGDLIKHNTLNMLFWIWPQPGSNNVFF